MKCCRNAAVTDFMSNCNQSDKNEFINSSQSKYNLFIDKTRKMSIIKLKITKVKESQSQKLISRKGDNMGVSDRIEAFITELLKEETPGAWLRLRRNELAAVFNCAPSQINYVIATRFNPERGYAVESRRGGGGYLKIKQISAEENPAARVIGEIGSSVDFPSARACVSYLVQAGAIDSKGAELILAAVSDNALTINQPEKGRLRASILKNMLAAL